jgi:hypothetical protein
MERRRSADDDEAWADQTAGDCLIGHISELREGNPPGRPFEPCRGPLGFCIDPKAYRPPNRRKRSRKVVAGRQAGG